MPIDEHERKFIEAFAAPHKRDRYLCLLGSKGGRRRFLDCLYHDFEFDSEFASLYKYRKGEATLETRLRSLGAPDECHVICMASDYDGKTLSLNEALTDAIYHSAGAAIISCLPGKLAYFEGEDVGCSYILQR